MIKIPFRKEHKNSLLITVAVLALIIFGVFCLFGQFLFFSESFYNHNTAGKYRNLDKQVDEGDPLITKVPDIESGIAGPIINSVDPSIGPATAKISIVQFSKYDCGFCKEQEDVLRRAMQKYGDKVRLIRKDYPEKDITSVSYQAAVAARCAQEQDKFWEYNDGLSEITKGFVQSKLEQIAEAVGINLLKFKDCLNNGQTRTMINDNIDEGDNLGITGVPFIFINQEKVTGEVSTEEIQNIIDKELNNGQNK